jgi:hypothetical protein
MIEADQCRAFADQCKRESQAADTLQLSTALMSVASACTMLAQAIDHLHRLRKQSERGRPA